MNKIWLVAMFLMSLLSFLIIQVHAASWFLGFRSVSILSPSFEPKAMAVYSNHLFISSKSTTNLYWIKILQGEPYGLSGSLNQINLTYPHFGNDFTFLKDISGIYILITGNNGINIYNCSNMTTFNWISLATYENASIQNYITIDYKHAMMYAVSQDRWLARWGKYIISFKI